jgi:hypothetical protein
LVAIDIGGRLADIKIAPALAYLTHWHELGSKLINSMSVCGKCGKCAEKSVG